MKAITQKAAPLLVLFILLHTIIHPQAVSANGPKVGAPAPPLKFSKLLNAPPGSKIDWKAMEGHLVVLEFWATWCGPCVASMPHWNELVEAMKGQPVHFIAITDENEAVITSFVKRTPIHSWIGLTGMEKSMADVYGIQGIPCTVIVNQKGIVAAVTHPARLEPEDIGEVLRTGKSSLPPLPEPDDVDDAKTEPAHGTKPLFEMTVRRSAPRPKGHGFNCWRENEKKTEVSGEYATVESALLSLLNTRPSLLDKRTELPPEEYDFSVRLPEMNQTEREQLLLGMFKSTFGLTLRKQAAEQEVYILTVGSTNHPGLRPSNPEAHGGGGGQNGGLNLSKAKVDWLPRYLEDWVHKPVFNETGLTNSYEIKLRWKMSKRELLLTAFDRPVVLCALEPDAEREAKLSPRQRRQLDAIRGKLPDSALMDFSTEERENIQLFREELAKGEGQRFTPEPDAVITAVKDQLGLIMTPATRRMEKLVVEKAEEPK